MSYYAYDTKGYVGDLASIGGWEQFRSFAEELGGAAAEFAAGGYTEDPAALAKQLDKAEASGSVDSTRKLLVDYARSADECLILHDGEEGEDAATRARKGAVYISKYSDEQPRDDHGRWTDGGGGSATADEPAGGSRVGAAAGSDKSPAAVEARFAAKLDRMSPAEMDSAYAKLEDAEGGKVLNVDTMRELSPDYLADRTLAAAVHEPASQATKDMYERRLAEAPEAGEKPLVLFTAGGTGSGKSTAVKGLPQLSELRTSAQLIYDTTMSGYKGSASKIDQALAAGKSVVVAYVYREPVDALVHGALTRAMNQEAKYGSGRTLRVEDHAATHVGAYDTLKGMQERYAGNPRVKFVVVDNSHGRGGQRVTSVDKLPRPSHSNLVGRLYEAVDQQYRAGKVSASVYQGFTGRKPPRGG